MRGVGREAWATLGLAALVVALALAAARPGVPDELNLELVASGYDRPVFVTHAGDERLFVVEQPGRIKIVGGGLFLDITSKVACCGEQGLLGLAFHPGYRDNGLFYVYYTRAGDGNDVLEEYHRSATDPNLADPASGRVVLAVGDPYETHNGGWTAFGPNDGFLYVALGDGGFAHDLGNRAQSLTVLLGKILRIDPRDPDGDGPRQFSVPADNPFVAGPERDEIWSYGLRNPWRCSFDRATAKLWCGDVGQNFFEEINRHQDGRGVNFGWRLLEGFHFHNPPGEGVGRLCGPQESCKNLPIAEYAHADFGGDNCAVTGGYVARRVGTPLYGQYVFADYCSGRVWFIPASFVAGTALPPPVADTDLWISSFGEDVDGRLYLTDRVGGGVHLLTDT
jgi:hypothetical protein